MKVINLSSLSLFSCCSGAALVCMCGVTLYNDCWYSSQLSIRGGGAARARFEAKIGLGRNDVLTPQKLSNVINQGCFEKCFFF